MNVLIKVGFFIPSWKVLMSLLAQFLLVKEDCSEMRIYKTTKQFSFQLILLQNEVQ